MTICCRTYINHIILLFLFHLQKIISKWLTHNISVLDGTIIRVA